MSKFAKNFWRMKKYILDLTVSDVCNINERYVLVKLTHSEKLPAMLPGQFAEVRVDNSPTTYLRRPISINLVDRERNELWLLIAAVGDGTRRLSSLVKGGTLNCVLPLGRGFTLPQTADARVLLVGGGVGVAPLLYMGMVMRERGIAPTFLLGARRAADLLLVDEFRKYGRVFVTTEDGSEGERGFVTDHSILRNERFTMINTCGPKPMMMAMARYAADNGIECEASLENCMACGVGACLCCVEDTTEGNVCVCTEGPVFNIRQLKW